MIAVEQETETKIERKTEPGFNHEEYRRFDQRLREQLNAGKK